MKRMCLLFLSTLVLFQFLFSAEMRVPAEFEKSEGVIMTPRPATKHNEFFAAIIRHVVAAGATPYVIVGDSDEKSSVVGDILPLEGVNSSFVEFLTVEYDELWARDYAPIFFYKDGERMIVDNES